MSQDERLTARISALGNLQNLLGQFENDFPIDDLSSDSMGSRKVFSSLCEDMFSLRKRVKQYMQDVEKSRSATKENTRPAPQSQCVNKHTKTNNPSNRTKATQKRPRLPDDPKDSAAASGQDLNSKRRRVIQCEISDNQPGSYENHGPTAPTHNAPPVVEYDDIDAEVARRLQANEQRRRRNATGETNPSVKRKRESGSSMASRESLHRSPKVKIRATERDGASGISGRKRKRVRSIMDRVAGNSRSRAGIDQRSSGGYAKGKKKKAVQ